MSNLVAGILKGDKRSISRAISIVDNNDPESIKIIQGIFKKTKNAKTIGFTGSAGSGKSTLIGRLASEFHSLGYKVAVIAVDPSSPITGGALLGDRVRMMSVSDEIYVRSLASRGAEGGISRSLRNVVRILDAAGYNLILVESVGAGQLEIEISKAVNITVVIFNPQTGDSIQAIKAGLTEIGDIYVINKSDLEGATILYNIISDLVGNHKKLVFKCSAKLKKGVKELTRALVKLLDEEKYLSREKSILENELKDMILNEVKEKSIEKIMKSEEYRELVSKVLKKQVEPFNAALNFANKIIV
ncbi:MAG: methylmalonyl Co-A mutase-associated GTPase MeaB [Nitrososphaeraceae archaeon]|nr:methylmalonyl Co-A mutase-associated GTPase MeaB [Nitrososphaeraceae archaeon]MDW0199586.1 methylmalonyl Co-A mutase-associated GTPase MeaB [Nitrososphaeraceae archaeon]MDW0246601.1 methylmalonyl Co-A mutase-associated GTPase MeaB [Nitrososphaeraceae archaeon]MDW0254290.1 methylmalonyl Co-A mutase-associated GTPase MeaB [Nitrososphaeraceae archaeon]MDW3667665.1 methylmalonyl Co-A mutase-associated GTPase MeaB [Nitrososphaeraceae archaeon]